MPGWSGGSPRKVNLLFHGGRPRIPLAKAGPLFKNLTAAGGVPLFYLTFSQFH